MCILFKDFSYSLQVTRIRDDGAQYGKNNKRRRIRENTPVVIIVGFDMNSKINKESL